MKRNSLISTLICAFCLIGQCALGQISEGGQPISFSLDAAKMKRAPVLTMTPVDVKSLLQEDEKVRKVKDDTPKPFRFGYAIDVDIDIKKVGVLTRSARMDWIERGKAWRIF